MNRQGRCFNIERSGGRYTITGPDESTVLYTVDTHSLSKPHVIITAHGNPYPQPSPPAYQHYPPPPPPQYMHGNQYGPQLQGAGSPYGFAEHSNLPPQHHQQQQQQQHSGGGGSRVVGTVTYHSLSSKFDITLNSPDGQSTGITMSRPDSLSSGREFHSSLGVLRWKEADAWGGSGQKLVDHNKREIARYEKRKKRSVSSWLMGSGDKKGVMTLVGQDPQVDMNAELILVTGIAWIEDRRRSDSEVDEIVEAVVG